ncbi:MAG: hypothetical protein KC657_37995 [Myxococcales bacterium]|nr:hypothetical protein [Myxococcales bacterium]
MNKVKASLLAISVVLGAGATAHAHHGDLRDLILREIYDASNYRTDKIEFPQLLTGDVNAGRGFFGLAPDNTISSGFGGLFEGNSAIYGPVVSNGTLCSSCHRPESNFMLPVPPISAHIAAGDPLLTGRNAEAQGDPRQAALFENHGLVKQRPNRFNPLLPQTHPYKRVFSWRKTQTIWNMAFEHSLLTDGRARAGFEQARGAAFTHTQDTDVRFDDIADPKLRDIVAWQQTIVTQPELKDLLDKNAPLYGALTSDPFYTVHPSTPEERFGQRVFERQCMSCHNMPNVFNNRDHIDGPPTAFPPNYGRTFDVGVGQANRLGLDYRFYDSSNGTYSTVILPLAREDGAQVNWPVTDDIGAAAATGRYEDLHRFRVPQLRRVKDFAPYFHDNSAATLEEVVDYFNSPAYNNSRDGRKYPVRLNNHERTALLAFLRIL